MLVEILIRIHIKYFIQSKCVRKSRNSILTTFLLLLLLLINAHRNRSNILAKTNPLLLLHLGYGFFPKYWLFFVLIPNHWLSIWTCGCLLRVKVLRIFFPYLQKTLHGFLTPQAHSDPTIPVPQTMHAVKDYNHNFLSFF